MECSPTHNTGWVTVGTDKDTAAFAVSTIASWWEHVGRTLHPTPNNDTPDTD